MGNEKSPSVHVRQEMSGPKDMEKCLILQKKRLSKKPEGELVLHAPLLVANQAPNQPVGLGIASAIVLSSFCAKHRRGFLLLVLYMMCLLLLPSFKVG